MENLKLLNAIKSSHLNEEEADKILYLYSLPMFERIFELNNISSFEIINGLSEITIATSQDSFMAYMPYFSNIKEFAKERWILNVGEEEDLWNEYIKFASNFRIPYENISTNYTIVGIDQSCPTINGEYKMNDVPGGAWFSENFIIDNLDEIDACEFEDIDGNKVEFDENEGWIITE